jgi:hypothetical protein
MKVKKNSLFHFLFKNLVCCRKLSNILRRSSRKRSAPRTMDSTTPSQPFAARRLPVTTQAIHHGQISTAPIVRTTSMPSTITQAVPQSTNLLCLYLPQVPVMGVYQLIMPVYRGHQPALIASYRLIMPVYKYNQPALIAIL